MVGSFSSNHAIVCSSAASGKATTRWLRHVDASFALSAPSLVPLGGFHSHCLWVYGNLIHQASSRKWATHGRGTRYTGRDRRRCGQSGRQRRFHPSNRSWHNHSRRRRGRQDGGHRSPRGGGGPRAWQGVPTLSRGGCAPATRCQQGVNVEVGKKEAAIDLVIVMEIRLFDPASLRKLSGRNVISKVESGTGLIVKEVNIEVDCIFFNPLGRRSRDRSPGRERQRSTGCVREDRRSAAVRAADLRRGRPGGCRPRDVRGCRPPGLVL